ncbi:unnamed protein product [Adineta steineri]|uniref:Uncharacterized protein n=1 Tax=Adineta steineri TaxID=433720 RepID=A0A814UYB8_9BILA|nr:unnamed protein product [Adineta steineri]CAF1415071.1 unnamed protein product [Adineta steineri]
MSRVDGEGNDDIGAFTINGIFCRQTQKLTLTKIYRQGTGKWFIHTKKYRGEDKFELKYRQTTESSCEMTKY